MIQAAHRRHAPVASPRPPLPGKCHVQSLLGAGSGTRRDMACAAGTPCGERPKKGGICGVIVISNQWLSWLISGYTD